MNKPLVSVIVPTYNSGKTIKSCLKSIKKKFENKKFYKKFYISFNEF